MTFRKPIIFTIALLVLFGMLWVIAGAITLLTAKPPVRHYFMMDESGGWHEILPPKKQGQE